MNGLDKLVAIAEEEGVDTPTTDASVKEADASSAAESTESSTQQQTTADNQQQSSTGDVEEQELISKFVELTGYEGEIADLSVETIANVVKDITAKVASKYAIVDNDPEVKALVEWKAQGNKLQDYFNIPQKLDKTQFSVDNDSHVKAVLESYYGRLKQLSAEEVEEQLDLLKASPDKLKLRFTTALDALEADSVSKYDAYQASIEAEKTKTIEDGKALIAVVNTGDFGNIKLAKDEITGFSTYLNDSTTYNSKWAAFESDPKKVALVEYLIYNDCDLSKLKGVTTTTIPQGQRKVPNLVRTSSGAEQKRTQSSQSEDEVLEALRNISVK